ncbi:MAG: DUF6062 family protein [Candidatus Promineifilaceae bacterium]
MKLAKRPSTFSYFELLDACKEPGCPICRLGQRSAQRHLTSVIYDGVNDVPLRATLRDAYGYCHDHAWLLPESGESAPLGIAIIHRDILNTLRTKLGEETFAKERRKTFRAAVAGALNSELSADSPQTFRHLPPKAICPACERQFEAEQLAFASLLEAFDKNDQPMHEALGSSDGLCISHLRQALNASRSQQAFNALVTISSKQLSALIDDLDEFIRKSDHRFREEKISDEEKESWRKALQRTSGKKIDQPDK